MEPGGTLENITEKCLLQVREGKTADVSSAENKESDNREHSPAYTVRFITPEPDSQVFEQRPMLFNLKAAPGVSVYHEVVHPGHRIWQIINDFKHVTLSVILCLAITISSLLAVAYNLPGVYTNFLTANYCTLSIASGLVEIKTPGSGIQAGVNGMELSAGVRVKTFRNSTAMLTFFDGSTLKMGPGTEVEVQELEFRDNQAVRIVLRQDIGSTWSSVVKMSGKGSVYMVVTPAATALVHGTKFSVEVDEEGQTTEHTIQGLVSVKSGGEEVFVPPGQFTRVEPDEVPTQPQGGQAPEEPQGKTERQMNVQVGKYTPPDYGPNQPDGKEKNKDIKNQDNYGLNNGNETPGDNNDTSGHGKDNADYNQGSDSSGNKDDGADNKENSGNPSQSNDKNGNDNSGASDDKANNNQSNNSDKEKANSGHGGDNSDNSPGQNNNDNSNKQDQNNNGNNANQGNGSNSDNGQGNGNNAAGDNQTQGNGNEKDKEKDKDKDKK